jgi:hypothetical protein
MNGLKLETTMTAEQTLITAQFTCRDDLERFLKISDQLLTLFPYPSPPPDPEPGTFEPGDAPAPTVNAGQP